jgi:hypothetical protein
VYWVVSWSCELQSGLYHADGQIDGEVYEYGSFLQSRMYAAGVACSNCHDPHSAKLLAEGNARCGQCHSPARFDARGHHHHEPDSAGAQCINSTCRPPGTWSSMRVATQHAGMPRPDLSVSNACSQCDADRPAE